MMNDLEGANGLDLLGRTLQQLQEEEDPGGGGGGDEGGGDGYDASLLKLSKLFAMGNSSSDGSGGSSGEIPYDRIMRLLNNSDDLHADFDMDTLMLPHRGVAENVLLVVAYSFIVVVSLFGNSLVCHIVWQQGQRSVTYVFIANLAVSDLIITVFNVPINIARNLMVEWVFGAAMCHLVNFTLVASVYASTLTMTAICIDRYRVILNPFKQRISRAGALAVVGVVWLLAAAFATPYAVLYRLHATMSYRATTRCKMVTTGTLRDALTVVTFATQYALPLCVIGVAYMRIVHFLWSQTTPPGDPTLEQQNSQTRNRRRTIKMLIIVVVVFALCWLPLNVYHVVYAVHPRPQTLFTPTSRVYFLFHWFAISSVCYNPFIYCYLNEKFRAQARRLFRSCFRMSGKVHPGVFYDGDLVRADVYYQSTVQKKSLAHTLTNSSCPPTRTLSIGLNRNGSLRSSLRNAIYVTSNTRDSGQQGASVSLTVASDALFLNRDSTESYSETAGPEIEEPEFEKV